MTTRKVTLQFTRPAKWKPLSAAIRAVQGTKYSHVRFAWNGMGGTLPVIYEASGSYLKFIGPIAAEDKAVFVCKSYTFDLSLDDYRKTVKLCMKYAGVRYGKVQVIGMGIAMALGLRKNPFSRGIKYQVCSEIAGYFLKEVLGWDIDLDLDIAGPKEIQECIEMNKNSAGGLT